MTTWKKSELDARVNDLELGSHRWYAATTAGVYSSKDEGKIWKIEPGLGHEDFVTVRAQAETIVAATRTNAMVSSDGGATWRQSGLPSYIVGIRGAAISSEGQVLVASREGVYRTGDGGVTWEHIVNGLPAKDITPSAMTTRTSVCSRRATRRA